MFLINSRYNGCARGYKDPEGGETELCISVLTIIPAIAEALLSSLVHGGSSHGTVHATWCRDVRRRAEASCCPLLPLLLLLLLMLLLLLLHQHHHPLPSHLGDGHHFSAALRHHLGVLEARLRSEVKAWT